MSNLLKLLNIMQISGVPCDCADFENLWIKQINVKKFIYKTNKCVEVQFLVLNLQ